MSALAEAALRYAVMGWPIYPARPRDKAPLIGKEQGGRGVHDATTDPDQVRAWWRRWPDANIAVGCGPVCWVLDVDGDEGLASLADLEDRYRWLPLGPASVTGSGGQHLAFASTSRVRNTVGRIGPRLDTRGPGGSAILPPSVHRNGCRYSWLPGREPWSVRLPETPAWLLDLIDPPRPAVSARPVQDREAASSRYLEAAISAELEGLALAKPGGRNQALFRAAARLGRFVADRRIDARTIGPALVAAAVVAGLPRHEAEATAASGLRAAIGSAA